VFAEVSCCCEDSAGDNQRATEQQEWYGISYPSCRVRSRERARRGIERTEIDLPEQKAPEHNQSKAE